LSIAPASDVREDVDDQYCWMTCVAAAQRLGATVRCLYRAIDRGDLPAYRIDAQIRLRRHEVERFRDRGAPSDQRPA
jgi:excisionase family DNA binding protein